MKNSFNKTKNREKDDVLSLSKASIRISKI